MTRTRHLIEQPLIRYWLWLMIATSSAVFMEPALCDILGIGLFAAAFALGLTVPRGLGFAVILVGTFLLGNLLASALAPVPSVSIMPMATRTYLILAWWLLLTCLICQAPKTAFDTLWNGYLFAALLAAALGTLAFFDIIPNFGHRLTESGRARALFNDPNVYGPFLVPAAILTLSKVETSRPARSVLFLGLFMFLGIGIILSFSRGAWVNIVVAVGCYFILRIRGETSRKKRRRLVNTAFGMVLSTVIALSLAVSVGPVREMLDKRAKLVQFYDVGSKTGVKKSRMSAQKESLRLALTIPVGIGAGQSEEKYYQNYAPHNLFLHVLVEAGWLGGLAFYTFLILTFRTASNFLAQPSEIRELYKVAYASALGILVQSLFVDSTHWRQLYMLLAMLWGPALALQAQRSLRVRRVPAY